VTFPEQDWRLLRSVHRAALDRYCARVLEECAEAIRAADISAHERYLRLYRLLQERDQAIATAFNDLRRSTALERLAAIISLGVVTDEELAQFSAPTRDSAMVLADMLRSRRKGS
jgi:hypothetical protein